MKSEPNFKLRRLVSGPVGKWGGAGPRAGALPGPCQYVCMYVCMCVYIYIHIIYASNNFLLV